GVHGSGPWARVAIRLDIDGQQATVRNADPLCSGNCLGRITVTCFVIGDVRAVVVVVDGEYAHMVAGCQRHLCGADSRANRVGEVATPEIWHPKSAEDRKSTRLNSSHLVISYAV